MSGRFSLDLHEASGGRSTTTLQLCGSVPSERVQSLEFRTSMSEDDRVYGAVIDWEGQSGMEEEMREELHSGVILHHDDED